MTLPISILDKSARGEGPFRLPQDVRRANECVADHARIAEELGYHRIWFPEHHANSSPNPCPSYSVLAAGLVTSRIRLGTGCLVAHYRHPIQMAETGAFLASHVGNRVDLGLGHGPGVPEAARPLFDFAADPDKRAKDLEASVATVALQLRNMGASSGEVLATWPGRPDLWLVGGSLGTACIAARCGVALALGWIPPKQDNAARARQAVRAYRESASGQSRCILVIDISEPYPGFAGVQVRLADPASKITILGNADTARNHLEDLARQADADELMITTGGLGGAVGVALWAWLAGGNE